jgi:hypothetical protein
MILVHQDGEAAIEPGQVQFDGNPLRLQAHRARWRAELEQRVESCMNGKQHWREFLPALKSQRNVIVERVRAALVQPLAPLRQLALYELLAALGEIEGVEGMATLLDSRDATTRRYAAIALTSPVRADRVSRQQIRQAIQSNDVARLGLLQMLFEPDRWNRRMAIQLCTAIEFEIGDVLCQRLAKEVADPRGETEALIHYLALRKKDLGAIRLFEELASRRNRQTSGSQLPLHSLAPYLSDGKGDLHDRVLKLLIDYLAANGQPHADDSNAECLRYNEQANAVATIAASLSNTATEALWRAAREDPHSYPRLRAWEALIRRQGLRACEALLASDETADRQRDAFNAVFWDPPIDQLVMWAAMAQQLLDKKLPAEIRKTLARLVRRQAARDGSRVGGLSAADETHDEFDLLEPEAAARQLVEIGAITAEEAADALALALRHRSADGYVSILNHSQILCVLDVESRASPPWYAELLADLSSNSRGSFKAECVRQLWYAQGSTGAAPMGIVQFICGSELIEVAVHDRGDYYDMPALLAAVNDRMERAGDARRFVPLGSGDQLCAVVFATASAAIEVAKIIQLPLLADADSPMRAGRNGEALAGG